MDEEVVKPNTPEPQEHQPSEVELRAMEQGWVPIEEWTGEPDEWRPAKEFIDRGQLFAKIDEQKRELKAMKAAMEEFGRHHAKVREMEYKRALATLKAAKKEALENDDHDAVVEIDEQIAEAKEAQKAAEAPKPQQTGPHPEFQRWEQRNAWYQTNRVMKLFADDIATQMVHRGETDPVVILQEVDKQVRKEFPDKFENRNRAKAPPVEGSTGRAAKKDDDDLQLTDAEKRIMNRIVATGAITKEKWLEEYKAVRAKGV